MTSPFYADRWTTCYEGDANEVLTEIPSDSIHAVITSPPYWGLRDYGAESTIGHEATPEEYAAALVTAFREVRRVLRPDGTLWLILGDTYSGGAKSDGEKRPGAGRADGVVDERAQRNRNGVGLVNGLKAKDLVGIPWRVAFALQADGWYLRSDIIWNKPNPMPEPTTDRPTKGHEYVFLLSKRPTYYYDDYIAREPAVEPERQRHDRVGGSSGRYTRHSPGGIVGSSDTRNLRTVWTIGLEPYAGSHFAVFPQRLAERCLRAGTPGGGVCSVCGKPYHRVVKRTKMVLERSDRGAQLGRYGATAASGTMVSPARLERLGWVRACGHDGEPIPAKVLDPFAGTGTVGVVARRWLRRAVLIDIDGQWMRDRLVSRAEYDTDKHVTDLAWAKVTA